MTRSFLLAAVLMAAGAAHAETAQERVARRVAEKYPAKVEEKLPYGTTLIVIRGCEYFTWSTGYGVGFTHLGNCTNHVTNAVERE